MEDVAPELLKKIEKDFREQFNKDSIIADLNKKLEKGTATHSEAYKYAGRVGTILTEAYQRNISSDALPEGKMWYNIANRVITPTMKQNYDFIAKYVDDVQENLNKKAGIGIKAVTPQLNNDRIKGIVNRISSEDNYNNISWILNAPVKTAANSIVDDSIKANSEFHAKAGMQPRIIRKTTGRCCKWCTQIAGIYEYPNVPKDVYRRHENCDCTVEYDPGDGKRQNVWSKQWKDIKESDKIEKRKQIVVEPDKDTRKTEYRTLIAENGLSYNESKALTDYVSSEAYVINDKLRKGIKLTNDEKKFCSDLDSALKKIPVYNGDISRSLYFYSENQVESFVNKLRIGDIKQFKEYISTTSGDNLYNPDGQVQLFIQNSKKGHDISKLNYREKEVLYEKNSRFRVISKEKFKGKWNVLLEEV